MDQVSSSPENERERVLIIGKKAVGRTMRVKNILTEIHKNNAAIIPRHLVDFLNLENNEDNELRFR
jgi:hypothetical protein